MRNDNKQDRVKIVSFTNDNRKFISYYREVDETNVELSYVFNIIRNDDSSITFSPYLDSLTTRQTSDTILVDKSNILFSADANTDVKKLYKARLGMYKCSVEASMLQ